MISGKEGVRKVLTYLKSLFPKGLLDRFLVYTATGVIFLQLLYSNGGLPWRINVKIALTLALAGWFLMSNVILLSNTFAKKSAGGGADAYAVVINKTSNIIDSLSELSEFLAAERAKIFEAEAAVRSLKEEKASLEPVVATNRETVAAILAAYQGNSRRAVWKERLVGFILGFIASAMSSLVIQLFSEK